MTFGIHKGVTIAHIIDQDPNYLTHTLKRKRIKLSVNARILLSWKITGHIKHKLTVDQHDTLSYYMFNDN